MALVRSRQRKVYTAKWSHSSQPRSLPVSQDTSVQEGNYQSHARHIWQGDTPGISAHVIGRAMCAEQEPYIGSWGNSTLGLGVKRQLLKMPRRAEYTAFKVQVPEAGSRRLLRQRSSTPQCAAPRHTDLPRHQPPEARPCWTADFVCSAAHLAPISFFARR